MSPPAKAPNLVSRRTTAASGSPRNGASDENALSLPSVLAGPLRFGDLLPGDGGAPAKEGHSVSVFTTDALHFERFVRRDGARVVVRRETRGGVSIRRFPLRHIPNYDRLRWRLKRLPFPAAPHLFGTGFLPGWRAKG